ncbi:MAG TPA: hypothetical protein VND62_11365 [Acidimicrobiales bacterium]|nr:hypothetical protein [Acidimicrobiales bacterium]
MGTLVQDRPPVLPNWFDFLLFDEEADDVLKEDAASGNVDLAESGEVTMTTTNVDVWVPGFTRSPLPRIEPRLQARGFAESVGVVMRTDLPLPRKPVIVGVPVLQ